jgi:hypothetical protein
MFPLCSLQCRDAYLRQRYDSHAEVAAQKFYRSLNRNATADRQSVAMGCVVAAEPQSGSECRYVSNKAALRLLLALGKPDLAPSNACR